MYTLKTSCRACNYAAPSGPPGIKSTPDNEKLIEVFDLGLQSLANEFCKADEEQAGFAPLKVLFCPRCHLAQLSVVVNPAVLYSKYSYITSNSSTMMEHFSALWRGIKDHQPETENVIEIGSNDGGLLDFLKHNGVQAVLGIDPAENLVAAARSKGIQSLCGLFDADTAKIAAAAMPKVDVVIARHVFCHVDHWEGFIKALDVICQKDTLVVIEVPYVMDLLRRVQFDTIYHEHLSYLNIGAMQALLNNSMFKLDHVQHFPIHGGAIALYLRRRDYEATPDDSVGWYLDEEKRHLHLEAWKQFSNAAFTNIEDLKMQVEALCDAGNAVCGFGAAALGPGRRTSRRSCDGCRPARSGSWRSVRASRATRCSPRATACAHSATEAPQLLCAPSPRVDEGGASRGWRWLRIRASSRPGAKWRHGGLRQPGHFPSRVVPRIVRTSGGRRTEAEAA